MAGSRSAGEAAAPGVGPLGWRARRAAWSATVGIALSLAFAGTALRAGPPPPAASALAEPEARLAELGDHTWIDLKPPARTVYQSLVPGGIRPNATLTPRSATGAGVTFTASEPVFRPGHVGHGLATPGERHAAVIRDVPEPTRAVADVVRPFPGTEPIAPGRWYLQPPVQCDRTIQSGGPVNRSYTGTVLGGGKILFWGGAHGTHPGNDIDLYDIGTNRWEVQAPPQCPEFPDLNWLGTGTFTNELAPARQLGAPWGFSSPDGEPYTAHNYQNQAYDPRRERFVWVAGGGTWAYSWRSRTLRLLAGPSVSGRPSPVWMSGGGLASDPPTDRVLAFLTSPQRGSGFTKPGVYGLELATDTWRFVADHPRPWGSRQVFSAYNSHAAEHVILLWPVSSGEVELWRYAPAAGAWHPVPSLPPELRQHLPSFDYDRVNRRVIFLQQRDGRRGTPPRLWAWDPVGDSWSDLGSGVAGPGTAIPWRVERSRFKYDARTNAFFLVVPRNSYCGVLGAKCGGESFTYAYRYRRAAADAAAGARGGAAAAGRERLGSAAAARREGARWAAWS